MKLPPHLYHLADTANWPGIERDGLLSATRLIRASGLGRAECDLLERTQRLAHTELPHHAHLRDQRPMPPSALERCLYGGMTPPQWYALINSHVFFWADPERLDRQRAACTARPQIVMTIDTQALVRAHGPRIAVTPFNTGNARRNPARRGAGTFVPLEDWLATGWATESAAAGTALRKTPREPVELTVADAVPDILKFVVRIDPLAPGQSFRSLAPESAGPKSRTQGVA